MKNNLPKILPLAPQITLLILSVWMLPLHSLWAATNFRGYGTEAYLRNTLLNHAPSNMLVDNNRFNLINDANIEITGKVTDQNGEPIPGATVSIPGTSVGTVTDIDGFYSLEVPEGTNVVFSFIGYLTQRITVGNQTEIDVTLKEEVSNLEDVIVVGFGVQKNLI